VVEFGYISLLPVYAVEAGASDSTALRLLSVLLLGGIVLQFGLGWLADHVDRTALLAALGVALAALAALLAVLITVDGLAFAAAFVLGGVVMAFYAVGLALLGQRVPRQRLVLANAGFLMAYEAGAVVGPLLGGIAIDAWPPHGIAVVTATAGLALAVYAWSARKA
jgi:MFS family permease